MKFFEGTSEYQDFKYVLQDTRTVSLGVKYTYEELLQDERVPFKFQAVISQYLLKEAAPETTLESEFYYMEKGTFVYETYRQLKARAKVRTQTVKKTMTGKEKIVYKEEIWTVEELAQMNLAIRGIEPDLGKYAADTFLDDQHPTMRADYIMANPPFNLSNWGAEQLKDDVRWQYGMPPASNANFAWLQHMIYHLAPGGRMGMVLANGSLSSQSGGEGDIRKNIVNADLVDCIIAMPAQLFYTTQIPVSLWFISKHKKQAGKTLFIDARKMGDMVSRKLRELTDEDIKKIADTYNAYVNGTLEDVKGFCAVVDTEKIAEQDYILTPGRYVGVEEQEDDGEPFEEKMARLTSELSDLFKQSHKLETEIKEKLGSIGYEI